MSSSNVFSKRLCSRSNQSSVLAEEMEVWSDYLRSREGLCLSATGRGTCWIEQEIVVQVRSRDTSQMSYNRKLRFLPWIDGHHYPTSYLVERYLEWISRLERCRSIQDPCSAMEMSKWATLCDDRVSSCGPSRVFGLSFSTRSSRHA